MFTSCTPGGLTGSLAIDRPSLRHQSLFEFERVDEHLLTAEDVEREAAAPRALPREGREHADRAAVHAPPLGGHDLEHQLGSLDRRPGGDEIEGELQRRGHHLAQVPDLHLDAGDVAPRGVALCDRDDGLGDRELVHQQIRGRGSPTSWSITRRPPNAVRTRTMPGGSSTTVPISAAASSCARSAASAASACSGATKATSLPSLATYIGSMPSSSAAPATSGRTGTSASRTSMPTPDARASSLSTEATPPRVASRRQRSAPPAASSSASTAGHSGWVSDSTSASSPSSPRTSMIAVPCSPIVPETRTWSPGSSAAGESAARGSRRPRPVVQTYIPSACALSTTLVSPATISTSSARAAAAIASTSARSTPASSPSSSTSDRVSATGRAPAHARSLTVPLTASSPIEPPGKRRGRTTKLSVVSARSPT